MEFALYILLATVPAYVLGSLNGSIIASKLFYRKDIRDYGSGNAGLTNFYRVFGKGGAIVVILIDVLKTFVPVLFGGWLFVRFFDMMSPAPFAWITTATFFGKALSGFAVMMGHCFPVFYKFKGGKGVMATGIIVIIIDWKLALVAWGIFIIVVAITRYVSLGSLIGGFAIPVSVMLLDIGGLPELIVIILCVLLIAIRHAENIKRIFKGEESKLRFKREKEETQ